jgi:tRNA(fMet)-specific endonuclease VapC
MMYALDSNVIIHYLRNHKNVLRHLDTAIINGDTLIVPRVVDYEIRRGFRVANAPAKEAAYRVLTELAGRCDVEDMDNRSWRKAELVYAELYRKGFTVGEMDILIAAYCLENNCTLVTSNTKDFQNIAGLQLEDWTK